MATMSPLRRRMIEDMTVRNLSPATQRSYLNAVSKFSRHFGRSPDRLGLEDVHAFQGYAILFRAAAETLVTVAANPRHLGARLGLTAVRSAQSRLKTAFFTGDKFMWTRLFDKPTKRGVGILALVSDAHGGFGGIAQYNRDLLEAFNGFETVREIVVLPRIAPEPLIGVPTKVNYNLNGLDSKIRYLASTTRLALSAGRFDLVYCNHVSLIPLGWALSRIFRVPLILCIYGIEAWQPPSSRLVRWMIGQCDLVMSISRITLDRFLSWCDCATKTSFAVVPNAIHLESFGAGPKNNELAATLGLSGKRVIMTLGRLSEKERYKGFDEIIELLPLLRRDLPDIRYLVVGDGQDRGRLEAKARASSVSDITVFTGRIPDAQKADYYRLADVFVMPSSSEGFGFVVLEALACGIPVIASKADGTREAVRQGELGRLVDPHEPDEIRQAIIAALQQPKAVPEGLVYFSFDQFAERIRQSVRRVVSI